MPEVPVATFYAKIRVTRSQASAFTAAAKSSHAPVPTDDAAAASRSPSCALGGSSIGAVVPLGISPRKSAGTLLRRRTGDEQVNRAPTLMPNLLATEVTRKGSALTGEARDLFVHHLTTLLSGQYADALYDGLAFVQSVCARPSTRWLAFAQSLAAVVRDGDRLSDRNVLLAVVDELHGRHAADRALYACRQLALVASLSNRLGLLRSFAQNFSAEQLTLFLRAGEALLATSDGASHTMVRQAAEACTPGVLDYHATNEQAVEAMDGDLEFALEAARMLNREWDGTEDGLFEEEDGQWQPSLLANENISTGSRVEKAQLAWASVEQMVPASLPTNSVMMLIDANERLVVHLAKKDRHPLSRAYRRDDQTDEASEKPEWRFLRYGFRQAERSAYDLMASYLQNDVDLSYSLRSRAKVSTRDFLARIWLAIHSPARPNASQQEEAAARERSLLRDSFFGRMAANTQLEQGELIRRCPTGLIQHMLSSIEGHYPFSLQHLAPEELLTEIAATFHRECPEPSPLELANCIERAVQTAATMFGEANEQDRIANKQFLDHLVDWVCFDFGEDNVAERALNICKVKSIVLPRPDETARALKKTAREALAT